MPVIIFAMDGLQPSQVTPELMPNLSAFASHGVFFDNHHPAYPSVTRINASTLMTGCYPGTHGLVANVLMIREYDNSRAFQALFPELQYVIDKTGRLLLAPTLAEILSENGKTIASVVTGSSGNAFLHNPHQNKVGGQVIQREFTLPSSLGDELTNKFGPWPERSEPDGSSNRYATRVLIDHVLSQNQPDLSIFWCNEPDLSQHAAGVNSEQGLEALKVADDSFGEITRWLETRGADSNTDVLVVSDHGYSTSEGVIEMNSLVDAAGFSPGDCSGGVSVGFNGGSVFFWVNGRTTSVVNKLAEWLMVQPWCGAITVPDVHGEVEGTLPARLVGQEGERAPDLMMSFKWHSGENQNGVPGMFYTVGMPVGRGDHGSMSKHEMKNTLIAGGNSFKTSARLSTPTGNWVIAPTVLHILGIEHDREMDGRIIYESLSTGCDPADVSWSQETHASSRRLGTGTYNQEIEISHVGKTLYVDQGSGRFNLLG